MAVRIMARVIQPLLAILMVEYTIRVMVITGMIIMVEVTQPLLAILIVEPTIKVKDTMPMRIMVRVIQPLLAILMVEHIWAVIIMSRVIPYLLPIVMVKDAMAIRIIIAMVIHTNKFSLLSLLMGTMATKDEWAFTSKMVEQIPT